MDDARAQLSVDAGKIVAHGVQQTVDQGIILVTGSRMHNQALGFVDHQQIIVFIGDVQLHFGGNDVHLFGFGNGIFDGISRV